MGDGDYATTILSIRRKIVFIGNPSTGKTSLLNRICNDKFLPDYDSTIGVDFFTKTIFYNENIFKIQLWDSAGQEKYRALIPSYIRGASIIFLVFDLTWRESFEAIKNWLGFVNQYTNKNQVKLILIGNKNDLERKIQKEEGQKMAEKEGMLCFETSAKTADGVVNMFYTSFSFIDFFNDKRKEKNKIDDNLVKELIEQNMSVNSKNKDDKKNNNIKNNTIEDITSKNDLLKNNKDNNNKNQNSNKNDSNNIKNSGIDNNINPIKLDKNISKKQNKKKKCSC